MIYHILSVLLRKPTATVPNPKLELLHFRKINNEMDEKMLGIYVLEQLRHAKGRHEDR